MVDLVPGLHDIERRAQAARGLHVGDPQRVFEAGGGLDVMGEREGGPGSAGPEPAESDPLARCGNDRSQRGEQIAH